MGSAPSTVAAIRPSATRMVTDCPALTSSTLLNRWPSASDSTA
jgi:hypothetical protein